MTDLGNAMCMQLPPFNNNLSDLKDIPNLQQLIVPPNFPFAAHPHAFGHGLLQGDYNQQAILPNELHFTDQNLGGGCESPTLRAHDHSVEDDVWV